MLWEGNPSGSHAKPAGATFWETWVSHKEALQQSPAHDARRMGSVFNQVAARSVLAASFFKVMDSANQTTPPRTLIVMGVSGCGKSSVAQQLAASLGWALHEGDAYHSEASIAKMRAGVPLTDEDRADWLARLARLLAEAATAGPAQGVVLTCSALKRKYRDQLRAGSGQGAVGFVFLDLDYETALQRVQERAGHFFSPELVANQFATLERPHGESCVLGVDATLPLAAIVGRVNAWLAVPPRAAAAPLSSSQP